MKKLPEIYRRRYIPEELVHLKDDIILKYEPGKLLVTRWKTLKNKNSFATGTSVFVIDKNIKVSKLCDKDGRLYMWYCDIVEMDETPDRITYNNLLFDVVEFPNGEVRVVDIGEAADAYEQGLITKDQLLRGMRATDALLASMRDGSFEEFKKMVNEAEKF